MLSNDAADERAPHIILFVWKISWQSEQGLTDGETKEQRWSDAHEIRKQIRKGALTSSCSSLQGANVYSLIPESHNPKHSSSTVLQNLGVMKSTL